MEEAKGTEETGDTTLPQEQEEPKEIEPVEEEQKKEDPVNYSCCKCRKILFNSDDIVSEHDSEVKKFNMSNNRKSGTVFDSKNCTSHFINQLEWINISTGANSDKIKCPHCDAKLGSFTWSGAQCSCGRWIVPAFQIHKTKVDERKPITLNFTK